MKESPIQRLILDWLAAEHILAFRINTGVAKFDNRFVAFGVKGMADILAFPTVMKKDLTTYGKSHNQLYPVKFTVWIECKATEGRQSPFQKSFQKLVESHGHTYVLARTLEDVQKALGY